MPQLEWQHLCHQRAESCARSSVVSVLGLLNIVSDGEVLIWICGAELCWGGGLIGSQQSSGEGGFSSGSVTVFTSC